LGIRERFELRGTKDDVIGILSESEDKAVLYESSGNQVLCLSWPPTSPLRFAQKHGGNYINDMAISSFGSNAVSVGDGVATLWNTSWNLPVQTISLPGEIYSVAFVPSSEKCLVGGDGYRIHRLDVISGRWLGTWQSLLEHNYAIVIDPDSDRFFTGGGSGRIHVGRLSDGKPLVVLEHPELRQRKGEHRIRRLAYSPVMKDLYAMTDGGILARWRMAPEPEPY
jgi:WD40 repeat protein